MSKRKKHKSDSDSDSDEFITKCQIYNVQSNWIDMSNSDIKCDKNEFKIFNKRYSNFKNYLNHKQIDITDILSLENITDEDRNLLIEKYCIMNNETDIHDYIKQREQLYNMIKYLKTTDLSIRMDIKKKKKELDNFIIDEFQLEHKILNMVSCDNYVQNMIYQKYKKLSNMSSSDTEYFKLKEWIETIIKIPFNNYKSFDHKKINLIDIKNRLDREIYGMNRVKTELLMIINQRLLNPSNHETSIALVGPPGVGKTNIISILANILEYPFEHISMGGINDSSYLGGHSYTYEGAKPGRIITSLIKMGFSNGILFFDEIDKIGSTSNGKEVSNQLLHITDFTQNDHFSDAYLPEIPIDLSKIWFIFSLNSIDDIDPILRNRLNFIHVDGYTDEEKVIITKDYLLKKMYNKYQISETKYSFTDDLIVRVIKNMNEENISGVRELKRSFNTIFSKLSLIETINDPNDIKMFNIIPDGYDIKNGLTEELIDILMS